MKFNFKSFLRFAIPFFVVTVCLDQLFDHGLTVSAWFDSARPFVKWSIASVFFGLIMQHFVKFKGDS